LSNLRSAPATGSHSSNDVPWSASVYLLVYGHTKTDDSTQSHSTGENRGITTRICARKNSAARKNCGGRKN